MFSFGPGFGISMLLGTGLIFLESLESLELKSIRSGEFTALEKLEDRGLADLSETTENVSHVSTLLTLEASENSSSGIFSVADVKLSFPGLASTVAVETWVVLSERRG